MKLKLKLGLAWAILAVAGSLIVFVLYAAKVLIPFLILVAFAASCVWALCTISDWLDF